MKKAVVTTTINPPTEAIEKFASMIEWDLIVVGDIKTPFLLYENRDDLTYINLEDQKKLSMPLYRAIGENSIRKRNFGFLYAYKEGYDLIATVDDDNIPYKNWGENLYILDEKIKTNRYYQLTPFFDPIMCYQQLKKDKNFNNMWHRGFPIQQIPHAKNVTSEEVNLGFQVQANMWNGDPDIDAICRVTLQNPKVKFKKFNPFTGSGMTPFNSQNTILRREMIPWYMMIPGVGRMDDIWGAYILQKEINPNIIFAEPTVEQQRNVHDLSDDLRQEQIGYQNSQYFYDFDYSKILPYDSLKAYEIYTQCFN